MFWLFNLFPPVLRLFLPAFVHHNSSHLAGNLISVLPTLLHLEKDVSGRYRCRLTQLILITVIYRDQ